MDANILQQDNEIQDALQSLVDAGGNLGPVFKQIGEFLTFSTKQRFKTSTAPDGSAWAENSEVSMLKFLNKTKGNFKKGGGRSSKGKQRAGNKKPLIGESKALFTTINYNASAKDVEVGSPMVYAGVMHYGAKQGAFGKNKRNVPLPWGDIPARPIFGLSINDRAEVLAIINDHYKNILQG